MRRLVLLLLTTLLALFSGWTARAENLDFSEIYSGYSAEGLTFSDKTQSLAGGEVTISGYMAPPLTPTIRFFVLTDNIIVVKVDDPVTALPYDSPITVSGTLEIGSETDPETGFVSQLRIHADSISG